jgi:hypothetical protein
MRQDESHLITRRGFLWRAAVASAVPVFPMILPSRLLGAGAPSNRVRVGHIGCGRIATGHDMPGVVKVELYGGSEHHKNWLECVKTRQAPAAPAPVAHRSTSGCIVSWIAMKLGRPLTWDAAKERFVNDAQANALLSRSERAPYGATRLARS